MVPISRPCSLAKTSRSGRRAIVPSSFITSQMTADGIRPAIAAMSQPASVWPARISTPPSCACSGKMWPGCTRSDGLASRATAACTVRERSAAEMPVVTPSAASMDTVNAVPCGEPLRVRHRRQVQALAHLARHRQADQAARVARHEVDRLGRDEFGREDQVAFVFAVFLVDEDDHAARGQFVDQGGNRRDGHPAIVGGGPGFPRGRASSAGALRARMRRSAPTFAASWNSKAEAVRQRRRAGRASAMPRPAPSSVGARYSSSSSTRPVRSSAPLRRAPASTCTSLTWRAASASSTAARSSRPSRGGTSTISAPRACSAARRRGVGRGGEQDHRRRRVEQARRRAACPAARRPRSAAAGARSATRRTSSDGIVGQHGADAREHRARAPAERVAVRARVGAGDPLAGAVGQRGAAVERRGDLHAHPRPRRVPCARRSRC